ncbi:hypothetical protein Tco_0919490 [Tanacetum coccineum]
MKRVNTFVDMNSEVVKGNEHVEAEKDNDPEEEEMKKNMEIVQDEEEIAIDVIPLSTKPPMIIEYKIVKEGHKGFYHLIRADGNYNCWKDYADREEIKKCLSDEPLAILLGEIHIDNKLHFIEEPMKIMDRKVKQLKQSYIPIIKVQWNSRRGPEFTWEREDQLKKKYPHLFTKPHPRQVSNLEPYAQGFLNGERL